jgi:Fe-S-cluster-containing dehydrogenase component
MSCPYGVRYLNEEERVVEKCTLCEQRIAQGELPACVAQCSARARFFGNVEEGIDSFVAPWTVSITEGDTSYSKGQANRITLKECVQEYTDENVHHLPNVGNDPSFVYILRDRTWQGGN